MADWWRRRRPGFRPLGEKRAGKIIAFDPATHRIVWQKDTQWSEAYGAGVLSTATGVMFIGQPDGLLLGLDIKDGPQLWSFQTGPGVHTIPITYEVGDEQYIAVFAGGNGLVYNSPKGDNLWALKLDGKVPAAITPPPPSLRQPIINPAVEGSITHNIINLV